MGRLITLDIRYDPNYPFDWVAQYDPRYDEPEPRFPYRNRGIKVLGLEFQREHVVTGGFDPYAGDVWKLTIGGDRRGYPQGPWLELTLSDLICSTATLEVRPLGPLDSLYIRTGFPWFWPQVDADLRSRSFKVLDVRRSWHKDMPRLFRKLWDFLEARLRWAQANEPQDPYDDYYGGE